MNIPALINREDAGQDFHLHPCANNYGYRMLLGLLSFLLPVESNTTIKETIIKDLDECLQSKKGRK